MEIKFTLTRGITNFYCTGIEYSFSYSLMRSSFYCSMMQGYQNKTWLWDFRTVIYQSQCQDHIAIAKKDILQKCVFLIAWRLCWFVIHHSFTSNMHLWGQDCTVVGCKTQPMRQACGMICHMGGYYKTPVPFLALPFCCEIKHTIESQWKQMHKGWPQ